MGSRVFHIIHNSKLFIASRALSSPPGVALVIHSLEVFIASKFLSSRPGVSQVNYNTQLSLLQKTKTRALISLALLKKLHYLVGYTQMLALVYYGTFISVIELNKLKDIGTYF